MYTTGRYIYIKRLMRWEAGEAKSSGPEQQRSQHLWPCYKRIAKRKTILFFKELKKLDLGEKFPQIWKKVTFLQN